MANGIISTVGADDPGGPNPGIVYHPTRLNGKMNCAKGA